MRTAVAIVALLLASTASAGALKNGQTTTRWGNQFVRGNKTVWVDKGRIVRSRLFVSKMRGGEQVGFKRLDDFPVERDHRGEWTTRAGTRIVYNSNRAAGTWKRVSYPRGSAIGRVTSSEDQPGAPHRYELDPMGSVSAGIAVLAHLAATTNHAVVTSPYGADSVIQPGESAGTALHRLDTLPKR